MFNLDIVENDQKAIVEITGNATIENITITKQGIEKILYKITHLTINASNLVRTDIAFLQLIICLKLTCIKSHIEFDISNFLESDTVIDSIFFNGLIADPIVGFHGV